MGVPELIARKVEGLPVDKQAEVLDFVEFLATRTANAEEPEDAALRSFALAQAMRGLEDEPVEYFASDCIESR